MNKISVVLLSCCLAASATFAYAGDGMSMERSTAGDAMMHKDAMSQQPMKKDGMAKTTMMKPGKGKHAMQHGKMHRGNKQDAMMRMQ